MSGAWKQYCPKGYTYDSEQNVCVYDDWKEGAEVAEKTAPVSEVPEGVNEADFFLAQSDFLSAKKSCDMFENTLISTRNNAYAKFDTQLKNYIDDEVAKLVKKKSKDLKTVADSFSSLKQTDTDITVMDKELEVEKLTSISEAQIAKMNAEANISKTRADTAKVVADAQAQLKNNIIASFSKSIINSCAQLTNTIANNITKPNSKVNIIDELASLEVLANYKGQILSGDDVEKNKDNIDYVKFSCSEMPDFYKSNAVQKIVNYVVENGTAEERDINNTYLGAGIYKVQVVGAGGGGGGGVSMCPYDRPGDGSGGQQKIETFLIADSADFTYEIGKGGEGGKFGKDTDGKNGEKGGDTTFEIPTLNLKFIAQGGAGGGKARDMDGMGECAQAGQDAPQFGDAYATDCTKSESRGKGGCGGFDSKEDNSGDQYWNPNGRNGGAGFIKIITYKL